MPTSSPSSADLTPAEIRRYARHLRLQDIGLAGQRRLKNASVLIAGVGGLGSPAALYLAAAGVGRLGLVDNDVVAESNLQRQVLYATAEVGEFKVVAAHRRLLALNPHIRIDIYPERLTGENAWQIAAQYDILVDGSDNFPTRYLLNDTAVLQHKPFVYGSVERFEGQVSVFYPPEGPCYRCIFPQPPAQAPNCAEVGVLGALPGVVGTLEATEALKLILGIGEPLVGRLLLYDALAMSFDIIRLRRNPRCPVCGEQPTITAIQPHYDEMACASTAPAMPAADAITPSALARALSSLHPPILVDVRQPDEFALAHIDGALNIPLEHLEKRLDDLPPGAAIVTVCVHGKRSAQAALTLKQHGFRDVAYLAGGLEAWQAAGDTTRPSA